MKKNLKLIILLFAIMMNLLILSGCWSYREVNDLLIVTGVAIDKNENNDGLILSIETISPKGGENVKMESSVYAAEGKTIFDAIRNSIQLSGKKMYWSHAKVIIVSKEIAKEGLLPILDFFKRSIEIRSDIWLLVSLDKTAKEILYGKDNNHNTISSHLDEILEIEKSIPKYHGVELFHFLNDLSSKGRSPIAPTTKIKAVKDMLVPKIFGTAVFKKDQMIGWLNEIETRNLIIIRGEEFKGGLILIENVQDTDVDVSLEIFGSKIKIYPELINDEISMNINIEMKVEIAEITQSTDKEDFISKEGREELKSYAEETIKQELDSFVKKVQREYKSDIFGFGTKIQNNMPDEWKKIENSWEDIFSSLNTEINIELTIQGSSLTSKPIKVN